MHLSAARFQDHLLRWYGRHRRDLPWRVPHLQNPRSKIQKSVDPYHVLLSEVMLQQTQVSTVIPYYHRFLERFPTIEALAKADEQDVLRLWQGLGYYSRARNLLAAARRIVADFAGQVPCSVEELMSLPGIGRYSAGAIASIAFDCRAPILDGNVIRVLCRIDAMGEDPRDTQTLRRLWARAEELVPKRRCGDFNSALMELGATICTPRSPRCLLCPVQKHCDAFAAGLQEQIPLKRERQPLPLERRVTFCVEHRGRWLIEQRPARGRWPGMWQFPTIRATKRTSQRLHLAQAGECLGFPVVNATLLGEITHSLSHRRYEFAAYVCQVTSAGVKLPNPSGPAHRWVRLVELDRYPLPRPLQKIAALLGARRDR